MAKLVIQNVLLEMGILVVIIALLVFLCKIYLSIITEKRIMNYAMENDNTITESLSDAIINFFYRIVKNTSISLRKSKVLKDYANYFDRKIIFEEDSKFDSMDYISMKFYTMLLFTILYFFCVIIYLIKYDFMALLLLLTISFFLIDIIVLIIFHNKKKVIEDQLLQAIVIMNNAFKSGKNITQAVDIVQKELPNPIRREYEIIAKDISYGLDLSVVFDRFAKRVKIPEAKYMTSSLSLLNKTGGNIVTVFNMIERTFYERLKIKNELHSLTAASRFLFYLLLAMPVVFVLVIIILNPAYFKPLIENKMGNLIIGVIIVLYTVYVFIIKRIMKVDEV